MFFHLYIHKVERELGLSVERRKQPFVPLFKESAFKLPQLKVTKPARTTTPPTEGLFE